MSSSMAKVLMAFIAGLVLALGSALIYVRAHEKQTPVTTAQVVEPPAQQPEKATVPEPPAAEPVPGSTQPEPAATPEPSVEKKKKTVVPRPKAHKPEPAAPIQVVENKPIPPPTGGQGNGPGAGAAPNYPAVSQNQAPASDPPSPAAAPPPPQPHSVELPAGTTLAIRLGEKLSTDENYTGDAFRGTLDQQIIRDGFIIADKGSKVLGRIAEADKAGRVRGVAHLSLVLTEINTTDGQRVAVETNTVEKQAQASRGADTAKIAGGAALGAIIGALGGGGKGAAIGAGAGGAAGTGVVLATRGKAAVLPNESPLTFTLANPVRITEKLNR